MYVRIFGVNGGAKAYLGGIWTQVSRNNFQKPYQFS